MAQPKNKIEPRKTDGLGGQFGGVVAKNEVKVQVVVYLGGGPQVDLKVALAFSTPWRHLELQEVLWLWRPTIRLEQRAAKRWLLQLLKQVLILEEHLT